MFDHDHFVILGLGAVGWALICAGLAHFAGWRSLARQYPASTRFGGRRFHLCSAQFGGWVGYNGSFTPGADRTGLYIAVWPIFRIGHPPLLVPWSKIQVSLEKRRWLSVALLTFRRVPSSRVRISVSLAKRLAAESAGSLDVPAA